MTKKGRPLVAHSDEDRPVTISLRIPRDLYERLEDYAERYQQTISDLVRDGLEWRLELDSTDHTAILDKECLLYAEDQDQGQPLPTTVNDPILLTNGPIGNTPQAHSADEAPKLPEHIQRIAEAREKYPTMTLRQFAQVLYDEKIYRSWNRHNQQQPVHSATLCT